MILHLQDVVVLKSGGNGDLLRNNHRILKIFIRDVVELLAMPYQRRSMVSRVVARIIYIRDAHLGITRE